MINKISIGVVFIGFLLIGYSLYSINSSLKTMTNNLGGSISPTGFFVFPVNALGSLFLSMIVFFIGFIFLWTGIRIL